MEEGLSKLEISEVKLFPNKHLPKRDPLLSLLKASQEWKIETLVIDQPLGIIAYQTWRTLAQATLTASGLDTSGHIGTLKYQLGKNKQGHEEDVKSVWEITEKMELLSKITNQVQIVIGGGRGEDPKTNWEEAYETLLKNICN